MNFEGLRVGFRSSQDRGIMASELPKVAVYSVAPNRKPYPERSSVEPSYPCNALRLESPKCGPAGFENTGGGGA